MKNSLRMQYYCTGAYRLTLNNRAVEHIRIAEETLGKYLPPDSRRQLPLGAVVHHFNGNHSDNRRTNLIICENDNYHMELHRRANAVKAGFPAYYHKCARCHNYGDSMSMILQTVGTKIRYYHPPCCNKAARAGYPAQYRRCPKCKQYGDPSDMIMYNGKSLDYYHHDCLPAIRRTIMQRLSVQNQK